MPSLGMIPEQILSPAEHLSVRLRNLNGIMFDVSKVIFTDLQGLVLASIPFYKLQRRQI